MTYEPQRADQLTAAPGVTRQRGWLRGKRLSSRRDLLSVRYKHPWARAVLTSFARPAGPGGLLMHHRRHAARRLPPARPFRVSLRSREDARATTDAGLGGRAADGDDLPPNPGTGHPTAVVDQHSLGPLAEDSVVLARNCPSQLTLLRDNLDRCAALV